MPPRKARIARSPMQRKPRPKAETLRIYGSAARREWFKRQPCVLCGRVPSDMAHLTNGGMSRKDDAANTVPLCVSNPGSGYLGHHQQYDEAKRTFRATYGDLREEAARVNADWLASQEAAA